MVDHFGETRGSMEIDGESDNVPVTAVKAGCLQ
jgi:hypothetical protein